MGIAIGWFASQGWTVCVPLTDSQSYDLVVDDGAHGLRRVAIRTTTQPSNGGYEVGLRTAVRSNESKLWDPEASDFLFVACQDGSLYLIPSADVWASFSIVLGAGRHPEYRVQMGSRLSGLPPRRRIDEQLTLVSGEDA